MALRRVFRFSLKTRAWATAALGVGVLLITCFTPIDYNPSIVYLMLLVAGGRSGSKAIWSLTTLFVGFTILGLFVAPVGSARPAPGSHIQYYHVFNRLMITLSLTIEAGILQILLTARQKTEDTEITLARQNLALLQSNTQLTAGERELDVERRRLQAILQTLPFGVTVGNADLSVLQTNPAGTRLLRMPEDEQISAEQWPIMWTLHRESSELALHEYPMVRAAREKKVSESVEYELRFNDGETRNLLIAAAPILDRDGEVTGAVGVFADVGEQKRLRDMIEQRRREAEEASVRKTRMLGAISHDIRNPVNAISLLAELIYRDAQMIPDNPDLIESTTELRSATSSLAKMLSEMLDLSRFDSGKYDIVKHMFSAQDLMDEICGNYAVQAREKKLKMVCLAHGIHLFSDRTKLARALANLIGNSIKFTAKGEIRCEIYIASDGRPTLDVSDTGAGIRSEQLSEIFEEFVQLGNPERDRDKGTGLGLSICRRIVSALGGEISVQSEFGKGSTFTIFLPHDAVAMPAASNT